MFQSTRPRGARPSISTSLIKISCFNPRARVGRDTATVCYHPLVAVSIHAPAWGATLLSSVTAAGAMFQSTRPRGARL